MIDGVGVDRSRAFFDGWNAATPYLLLEDDLTPTFGLCGGLPLSIPDAAMPSVQGASKDSSGPRTLLDVGLFDKFLASLDAAVFEERPTESAGKCAHLLALVDAQVPGIMDRKHMRQLVADAQPRQSKWV